MSGNQPSQPPPYLFSSGGDAMGPPPTYQHTTTTTHAPALVTSMPPAYTSPPSYAAPVITPGAPWGRQSLPSATEPSVLPPPLPAYGQTAWAAVASSPPSWASSPPVLEESGRWRDAERAFHGVYNNNNKNNSGQREEEEAPPTYVFADDSTGPLGAVGIELDSFAAAELPSAPTFASSSSGSTSCPPNTTAFETVVGAEQNWQHVQQQAQEPLPWWQNPSEAASSGTAPPGDVIIDVVPAGAPRLIVPTNLSLEQVVLLDLVALAVAEGGPSVEEELVLRETRSKFNPTGNDAFRFLNAPLSDPRMRYYRWRLYSLLQGDSLTVWRTEPFQMEQGPEAYVWVPPPRLAVGPDVLRALWEKPRPKVLPASALWMACACSQSRVVFAPLSADDQARWRALLDPGAAWRSDDDDDGGGAGGGGGAGPSHESPAPSTRKRQRVVDVAESDATSATSGDKATQYARLFQKQVVAERMSFAVDHMASAYHVMSLLLDAMLAVAHRAASASASASASGPQDQRNASAEDDTERFECSQLCLWYVFIVHDIIYNAGRVFLYTEEDMAARYEKEKRAAVAAGEYGQDAALALADGKDDKDDHEDAARRRRRDPKASGLDKRHVTPSGLACLVDAVEMVLPTLIEVCATVIIAAFSPTVRVSPSVPPSTTLITPGLFRDDPSADPDDATAPPPPPLSPASSVPLAWCAVEGTVQMTGKPVMAFNGSDKAKQSGLLLLGWLQTLFPLWFGYRKGHTRKRATTVMPSGAPVDGDAGRVGTGTGTGASGESHASAEMLHGALQARMRLVLGDKYAFLVSPEAVDAVMSSARPASV